LCLPWYCTYLLIIPAGFQYLHHSLRSNLMIMMTSSVTWSCRISVLWVL